MSDKRRILIQLDTDARPSVFDRVVAVDAGAEAIFSYGGVAPEDVRDLIHGAIFTRGPKDLHRTAVFIGGKDVARGEEVLQAARGTFLGRLSVSLMLDSSGANTTAAAAVRCAAASVALRDSPVLVLGGTGSVGRRVARLLLREGARVRLGSRRLQHAADICGLIGPAAGGAGRDCIEPAGTDGSENLRAALEGVHAVIAAGATGVELLPAACRREAGDLRVAIDLNAVPPAGIEGVDVMDRAVERDGVVCYGAIGVGGLKMKIHKAAVAALFESNDKVLDAEAIFEIGRQIALD